MKTLTITQQGAGIPIIVANDDPWNPTPERLNILDIDGWRGSTGFEYERHDDPNGGEYVAFRTARKPSRLLNIRLSSQGDPSTLELRADLISGLGDVPAPFTVTLVETFPNRTRTLTLPDATLSGEVRVRITRLGLVAEFTMKGRRGDLV